jgi:membrane-associated protease RseP (regulator of RpoE activity)
MALLALLIWPLSMLLYGAAFFGSRAVAAFAFGVGGAWVPFRRFRTLHGGPPALWARPAVAVAGPLGTYLVAAALIVVGALLVGTYEYDNMISVRPGSPADTAGLQDQDRIVRLAGTEVRTFPEITAALQAGPEAPLEVVVERGGERISLQVFPEWIAGKPKIGVAARDAVHRATGVGEALSRGLTMPLAVMGTLYRWIFAPADAPAEVTGPAGIVRAVAAAPANPWLGLPHFLGLQGSMWWPMMVMASLVFAVFGWKAEAREPLSPR